MDTRKLNKIQKSSVNNILSNLEKDREEALINAKKFKNDSQKYNSFIKYANNLERKIQNLSYSNQKLETKKDIKDIEFEQLIKEVSSFRFTQSKDLSSYIIKNQLGNKYQNISGILEMEKDGNRWDFDGGFSPEIYAKICERLNLNNQFSGAKVVGFKSFKRT